MKKILIVLLIIFVGVGGYYLGTKQVKNWSSDNKTAISSFEDCVNAGYPVLTSYPRQCKTSDKSFSENVGNLLEKSNLIKLDVPRPNQKITSPLLIQGQAKGSWYFEAQFPIVLLDSNGKEIGRITAKSLGDWMSPDFVAFTATLTFTKPQTLNGELVLKKDNPSGLPENDDQLRIPVKF